ncbi:DUF4834 family protein, partial [Parabacteroides sp. OttesenSCG-928-N08]|nr:DUF4834 family protein [Parabacteroides sp. OttesenSCG-928-N08]
MFRFLFILVGMFFVLMLLMGFSVVRTFKNLLFGGGRDTRQKNTRQQSSGRARSQQQRREEPTPPPAQRKKIISKDEGEYIDYEEVD